jgi:MFS transporter, DHA3 family, macrolide efflux protein
MFPLSGMRAFSIMWLGQVLSLLGSGMTRFAFIVWAWQQTGEATALVLIGFFTGVPALAANFFAGPLVDRWNRKTVIIAADLGSTAPVIILLALLLADRLEVWHLYLAGALAGASGAFHLLAFTASVTTMLPRQHYARASGMISLAEYIAVVGAPVIAGMLLGFVGLAGILVLDMVTFVLAVAGIALVRIPPPARDESDDRQPLWREALFGFRHIFSSVGLRALVMIYVAFSLFESLGYPLIAPMILARSGDNELILGTVQSAMGIGGVVGGVLLSIWGGPKRRIHGLLWGVILTGLLGDLLMGLGQTLIVWLIAAFCLECFIPLLIGSGQAIWQVKVAPAIQGRVFAARRILTDAAGLAALLLAGVLADNVFEPAMMPGQPLAESLGGLVGTGPGAGMALLVALCGLLAGLVGVMGYLWPVLRQIEDRPPDQTPQPESA